MMKTMIQPEVTTDIKARLNTLLATYQVHYQRLRSYHWNVKGQHFFELHLKFEELYNDAALKVDEIAERLLMLGARPFGNLSEYLDHSHVEESNPDMDDFQMMAHLAKDFEILLALEQNALQVAQRNHDEGTADMLTAHIRFIEKQLWMFRSWLVRG